MLADWVSLYGPAEPTANMAMFSGAGKTEAKFLFAAVKARLQCLIGHAHAKRVLICCQGGFSGELYMERVWFMALLWFAWLTVMHQKN